MFNTLKSMIDHRPLSCPDVTVLEHLDAESYMGVFYEQSHVKNEWFMPDQSICT